MDKKCYGNIKMFPNTISFKVSIPQGEKDYSFTSYVYSSRNKCFDLIRKFLTLNIHSESGGPSGGSTVIVTSSDNSSNNGTEPNNN